MRKGYANRVMTSAAAAVLAVVVITPMEALSATSPRGGAIDTAIRQRSRRKESATRGQAPAMLAGPTVYLQHHYLLLAAPQGGRVVGARLLQQRQQSAHNKW